MYTIAVVNGTKLKNLEGSYETLSDAANMCHTILESYRLAGLDLDSIVIEFVILDNETGKMYPYYEN